MPALATFVSDVAFVVGFSVGYCFAAWSAALGDGLPSPPTTESEHNFPRQTGE